MAGLRYLTRLVPLHRLFEAQRLPSPQMQLSEPAFASSETRLAREAGSQVAHRLNQGQSPKAPGQPARRCEQGDGDLAR